MRYITPITDRTLSDVLAKNPKAFLNIIDWTRIDRNTEYAASVAEAVFQINLNSEDVFDPLITSIPTVAQLNTLLRNIQLVLDNSGIPISIRPTNIKTNWLEGTAPESPDYVDVNAWEQAIETLRFLILNTSGYLIYCGVAAVGQPRFYQHRWRTFPYVQASVSPVRRVRVGIGITNAPLTRNNSFRRYD